MIAIDDLTHICPQTSAARLAIWVKPLNAAMDEFEINQTIERETAFLAQIAHESGGFRYARGEIASGEEYDTGRKAAALGNTPEADGDGQRFKGRGLIQITGRANYEACGAALGVDLLADPTLLEYPDLQCRSAGWYWASHGCNDLADKGDFLLITKRINGGYNGYADRLAYYERAKEVFA